MELNSLVACALLAGINLATLLGTTTYGPFCGFSMLWIAFACVYSLVLLTGVWVQPWCLLIVMGFCVGGFLVNLHYWVQITASV